MTDREMLELAAMAGGIRHIKYENDYDGLQGLMRCDVHGYHTHTWNPRDDDGDAFRLAVKVGIGIHLAQGNTAIVSGPCGGVIEQDEDINAATRLAITRAAAEVGKGM